MQTKNENSSENREKVGKKGDFGAKRRIYAAKKGV